MRAIMVCVDYADLLAITLPYNIHHFEQVWIVTDFKSHPDVIRITKPFWSKTGMTVTDAFYRNGAKFNKWAALEEGLDAMGRHGWLCLMDADVLWPKNMKFGLSKTGGLHMEVEEQHGSIHEIVSTIIWQGQLCTPLRRMWNDWPAPPIPLTIPEGQRFPKEEQWSFFPIHRNVAEWAGYSQLFHADDPVLGPPPWHEVDWVHAGGADSFFQQKWPAERKVRPPFEVLHLGPAGQNWFGRATPLADGTVLEGSGERREMSGRRIWEERRRAAREGRDRFEGERVKKG